MFILSPSCFAVCGYHLPPRIAIVFSLLSNMQNSSMPHTSNVLISSNASRSSFVYFTFSYCLSPTLLLRHTGTYFLPPPDYCFISFFFLVGPGPLHEIAVSAFSRSPLGRADTFSYQHLPSTPRIYLKCFSSFPFFLSASLSPSSILSFTTVLYPPNFSIDSTSSWSSPKSFHIFSTTLSHLIPARHFVSLNNGRGGYLEIVGISSFFKSIFFVGNLLRRLAVSRMNYQTKKWGGGGSPSLCALAFDSSLFS